MHGLNENMCMYIIYIYIYVFVDINTLNAIYQDIDIVWFYIYI